MQHHYSGKNWKRFSALSALGAGLLLISGLLYFHYRSDGSLDSGNEVGVQSSPVASDTELSATKAEIPDNSDSRTFDAASFAENAKLPTPPEKSIAKTVRVRARTGAKTSQVRRENGFLTGPTAGEPLDAALGYLSDSREDLGYSEEDFVDPLLSSSHTSKHNGVTYLYLRQRHQGIEVYGGDTNVNVAGDGSVISANVGFIANIAKEVDRIDPLLSAEEAVRRAGVHLQQEVPEQLVEVDQSNEADQKVVFEGGSLSQDPIPTRLMLLPEETGETKLVWNTVLHLQDGAHWLDMNVNAESGEVLTVANWVAHADYRVFDLPLENPDNGGRSLVTDPHDPTASPFGWHDTNGATGAESNNTRGNNVNAQEDADANNSGGARPNGGAGLNFDFALDLNQAPDSYESASITNLFYWNNILHDLHYQYGFDESSGNFQANNYGNGGAGGDPVEADSLDGSGTNNANFATPPDGQKPRMQMYLWEGVEGGVTVNSPASISGAIEALSSSFGPVLSSNVTANVVLVNDGSSNPTQACQTIINTAALSGKIAFIDRGGCNFVDKVRRAQNAGAAGVIVANSQPGGNLIRMTGTDPLITIPSFFISYEDGLVIRNQISGGVSMTLGGQLDRDSALDNLVIIHEYGHGVSNRLTGGSANSSALSASQSRGMGEGWSDWWGLVLTAKPSDTATTRRTVGNYLLGQSALGAGIRPAPYTTDLNENPLTFGHLRSGELSVPHGIGSVWCTVLWEAYWNLVTAHGFDPDFYQGTGGNNIALQLIMDGLQLQPANPTYLDARDAIILADTINNGGANRDLLWQAFAKRGMGFSAYDGGSPSSLEVVESFDLPDDLKVDPGARDPFFTSGNPGGGFLPASRSYTLENTGSGPLNWDVGSQAAWLNLAPTSGSLSAGQTVSVVASLNGGANALPLGIYNERVTFRNLSSGINQGRDATLSVNQLSDALEATGLSIFTNDPPWFPQTAVTHDGSDAAQSGAITHDQVTSMQTTVNGPDTLVFWWKVSSEEDYDFMSLLVDGVVQKSISGEVAWTQVSVDIPAGAHEISWEYRKDFSVDEGLDTAWVDQIELVRDQPPIMTSLSSVDGLVGTPFSYQIQATENPTSYGSSALPFGLSLDPNTGLISGTPTVVGTNTVTLSASNTFGAGQKQVEFSVRDVSGIPFTEDFESGALGNFWLANGTNTARNEVTQSHGPHEGNWHFTMDSSGGEFSRNELTVALNLAGKQDVLLTFWAKEFGDESNGPPPTPFTRGADFDGVAISEDGINWYEVKALRGGIRGAYGLFAVELDEAIAEHGLNYNASFRIRFNHFDNDAIPQDGFGIDDIRVQSVVLGTTLELTLGGGETQTFSGVGTPSAYITLVSNRDGLVGNTTADGSGNWSIDVSGLRGGSHQITASVFGIPITSGIFDIEGGTPPSDITNELISFESTWRYLDNGSDQYTPATPFYNETFDDSTWAEGVARFGYGGDEEVTEVSYGGNASNKHIATYFRKSFTYEPGDVSFERLMLSLYADDGVRVYLNGTLLQRHRMPGGTPTHTTLASSVSDGDNERRLHSFEFDKALIREGENRVAVSVHQRTANSDDLGFDLRLALTRDWFFSGVEIDPTSFREMEEFSPAEVDGDGNVDLIYTHNESGTVQMRYRLNLGNNLLDTPQIFDNESFYQAEKPIISDLNLDGKLDCVVYAQSGAGIRAYVNNGSGFSRTLKHSNFSAYGTCLGDINGDGYPDLIYQFRNSGTAGTTPYPLYWRPNDQSGDFGNPQLFGNVAQLSSGNGMHATDLDGDGDIDVVASIYWDNRVAWFENDGSGSFTEHAVISGTQPVSLEVGDLDGDGDADLLFDFALGTGTFWHENDGLGGFGRRWAIQIGDNLDFIRLRDLDADGDLDLLCRYDPFNDEIWWRENDGKGNFTQAQQFRQQNGATYSIGDLDAADWNADGYPDVLLRLSGGGELILLQSKFGAGPRINTFTVDDNTVAPGDSVTLTWTTEGALDVKLDGVPVAANGSAPKQAGDENTEFVLTASNDDGASEQVVTVFIPGGGFETEINITDTNEIDRIHNLAVGDIDGNGTEDVVIAAEYTHRVAWVSNDGTGQFSDPILLDEQYLNPSGVTVGDFDGDGDNDIVMMSSASSNSDGPMVLYRNNGDGSFAARQVIDATVRGGKIRSRDMNNDGNLDLIYYYSNDYHVRLGSGSGTFLGPINIGLSGRDNLKFADMSEDGIEDLIYISEANVLTIYPARGVLDYPWEDRVTVATSLSASKTVEVSDYNNDGHIDIIVIGDNRVTLFLGKGLLQFDRINNEIDHLDDVSRTISRDFDQDGDQDIIFLTSDDEDSSNPYEGQLYWLEGDRHGKFSQVQMISESVPNDNDQLHAADFDGDGYLDILTGGGSYTRQRIVWSRNATRRAAPATLSSESDSGLTDDNLTSTTNPDFTGSAGPGATIVLRSTLDGIIGTTTADGSGFWSITGNKLSHGNHQITVSENGGTSSASLNVEIDTIAEIPHGLALTIGSDSGASDSDALTNVVTPVITGTSEAGASIELVSSIDGAIGTGTANSDFWITTTTLSEGTHQIQAKSTDLAGNESELSNPVTIVIDTTPPAAIAVPDLASPSDSGTSSTDNLTNSTTLTFGGSSDEGVTVTLFSDGAEVGSGPGGANWSIVSSALTNGAHNITASQSDPAGNNGIPSSQLPVTVDLIDPTILITTPTANPTFATETDTIDVSGSAADSSDIEKVDWVNALGGQGLATGTASWTVSDMVLQIGVNTLTLTATDKSGNTHTDTLAVEYTTHVAQSYSDWATANLLSGADRNPESAPFGDGVRNLVKYAFNMDGRRDDVRILEVGTGVSGLPAISFETDGGNPRMRCEFLRRTDSDLTYSPVFSTDIENWIPMSGTPVITPIDVDWERVVIEHPVDTDIDPEGFIQVTVDSPLDP